MCPPIHPKVTHSSSSLQYCLKFDRLDWAFNHPIRSKIVHSIIEPERLSANAPSLSHLTESDCPSTNQLKVEPFSNWKNGDSQTIEILLFCCLHKKNERRRFECEQKELSPWDSLYQAFPVLRNVAAWKFNELLFLFNLCLHLHAYIDC